MKLLALAVTTLAMIAPVKTVKLAIIHTFRGCHIWQTSHDLGPKGALTLERGSRIVFRVSCPMDFRLVQVRGPAVALGDHVFHTGTQRTIVFSKRGTYVFTATNLQSSTDLGLQTLGADNALRLTVRVV